MKLEELRALFQPKAERAPKPKRHEHDASTPCEGFHGECGRTPTDRIPAMTAYHWDGEGEDPNRDVVLCEECAQAYCDHWDAMWSEYRDAIR